MKKQQKQYAICTDAATLIDNLERAKKESVELLALNPDKTIYITEVIGQVSNGVQWDMKRTRRTKVNIQVDSQRQSGGGTT